MVHTMLMLLYCLNVVSDGSRERKIDLQTAFKGLGEYLLSIEGIQSPYWNYFELSRNCYKMH